MRSIDNSPEVEHLARTYLQVLNLPEADLWITSSRPRFESWIGRRVNAGIGGAYIYLPKSKIHAILINVTRIDHSQPRALEVVVCEELLHMRHRLDGDRRRHAKHGYDRIAVQVAELTGASMDEIRGALMPVRRQAYKYRYECPTCGRSILRKRKGTWSCGLCSPRFSRKHVFVLKEHLSRSSPADPDRQNELASGIAQLELEL